MITSKTPKLAEAAEIGLSSNQRHSMIDALAGVLADQHVLYIKLRNYHWNLIGPRFHSLHEFFEKQYSSLEAAIDQTAERIRMLGGVAPGSMASFLKTTSLAESDDQLIYGDEALAALIEDHEACTRSLRQHIKSAERDFNDIGTADFLTGLLRQHEMDAWMLRSYLERPGDDASARKSNSQPS